MQAVGNFSLLMRSKKHIFPHQMDKDSGRKSALGGAGAKGWNKESTTYRCTDGVSLLTLGKIPRRDRDESAKTTTRLRRANWISYHASSTEKGTWLFVSGAEFSRNMSRLVRGAKYTKTTTFPSTVREVPDGAFR